MQRTICFGICGPYIATSPGQGHLSKSVGSRSTVRHGLKHRLKAERVGKSYPPGAGQWMWGAIGFGCMRPTLRHINKTRLLGQLHGQQMHYKEQVHIRCDFCTEGPLHIRGCIDRAGNHWTTTEHRLVPTCWMYHGRFCYSIAWYTGRYLFPQLLSGDWTLIWALQKCLQAAAYTHVLVILALLDCLVFWFAWAY